MWPPISHSQALSFVLVENWAANLQGQLIGLIEAERPNEVNVNGCTNTLSPLESVGLVHEEITPDSRRL